MDNNQSVEIFEAVKRCAFFSELPIFLIEKITAQLEIVELKRGDILFNQGDISDSLYILAQGKLISFFVDAVKNEKIVGIVNVAETVGELGVISGESRSLSLKAAVDSRVFKLKAEIFQQLSQEYPVIMSEIIKVISRRSINTIRKLSDVAEARLAVFFPANNAIDFAAFQANLMAVTKQERAFFIFENNFNSDEFRKALYRAEHEKKAIYLFLPSLSLDIFHLLEGHLAHFFVIANGDLAPEWSSEIRTLVERRHRYADSMVEIVLLHDAHHVIPGSTLKWLSSNEFRLHHHIQKDEARDYQRLQRFILGEAITVIFSGGAVARGAAHLGVMKALRDHNIPLDAMGGSSSGAVLSALYALTLDYEKTHVMAMELTQILPRIKKLSNFTWPIISLFYANPFMDILTKMYGDVQIEDLWIPYFCITANVSEGKEAVQKTGLLLDYVLASCSVPGIMPPIVINGCLHSDGGLFNNLPVDIMREWIDKDCITIASQVSMQGMLSKQFNFPKKIKLRDVLMYKLGIATHNYKFPNFMEFFLNALLSGASHREEKNSYLANYLIKPALRNVNPILFEERIITEGYEEACRVLKPLFDSKV